MKPLDPFDPFDKYIRTAVNEFHEEELENLPEEDELKDLIHPSPFFFARMKRLIRLERHRRWKRKLVKTMRYVGVVCIAFLSILGGLSIINQDARASLQNFFKQTYDKYVNIEFSFNEDEMDLKKNYKKYLPHYLPEGYELTDKFEKSDEIFLIYSNKKDKYLFYSIYNPNYIYNLDVENNILKPIFIHGQQAELYLSNNNCANYLLYPIEKNSVTIVIKGNISESELIAIAESVMEK